MLARALNNRGIGFDLGTAETQRGLRDEDEGHKKRPEQGDHNRQPNAGEEKGQLHVSAHQHQRQEYDNGGQRCDGDRQPDFAGARDSRFAGGQPLAAHAVDVFQNHNCIIDHHSHAHDKSHHGQHIERPSEKIERRNRNHHTQRNR